MRTPIGWVLALAGAVALPAAAQHGVSNGDWPNYGGDKGSTKYSDLDQINQDNVAQLEVAWEWDSVDNALTAKDPRLIATMHEATPLVIDGVMYTETSFSQAAAINPETGETIWSFDPKSYEAGRPTNLGFIQRGVSYWTDGTHTRIYFPTGDAKLWCLDATTGEPVTDWGDGGSIDLAATLRRPTNSRVYSANSPPMICRDTVIIGGIIFDGPSTMEMPPGDVRGFDALTGELKWTFYNPPKTGDHGSETWEDGSNEYTGNANVWTLMSADDELGYVYLPFGTPTNDWYGGHRKGDNLFAESIVCVEADTGQYVWHFQTTHHGLWDYDLPSAPTLMDVTVDGEDRKGRAQNTKQGFVFVLDRVTGEPIWPIVETPVPQSTVEGEQTSPTQPIPTKPAPYERQGVSEDELIDFTPEIKTEAEKILSQFIYGDLYTPPSDEKPTIYLPGWGGGANWMGAPGDPETGMLYIPSMTGPISLFLQRPDAARSNFMFMGRQSSVGGPFGLPLFKPPFGRITALDLNTGDDAWMVPHGRGPVDHPKLQGLDLPELGTPGRGHPVLTKTMLFAALASFGRGTAGGDPEPNFRAFDKSTGELVHEMTVPGSISGTPMTYMAGGKQYIVMPTGGRGEPQKLIALSLPDAAVGD